MSDTAAGGDLSPDLIRGARAGDAEALERLLRALYPSVLRWALVKTGGADEAQDVTQEVMVRVSRYIRTFSGRSKITTWAYQITSHVVTDRGRRSARHRHVSVDDVGDVTATAPSTGDLDDSAAADLVRTFFHELPPRQREVFDLVDLQGYRSSEIAEMLGMSGATVRGHLLRARRFIRRKMLETNPQLVEAYGREL